MLRMLLRRCVLGAVTVAIVSAIIFLGVELLPGDACTAFLERDAKGQMLENCRKDFGLDRPALTRYFELVRGTARSSPSYPGRYGSIRHRRTWNTAYWPHG